MIIHCRIICLPSVWKEEVLGHYIKLKNDLGSEFHGENHPNIYWKDKHFVIFEESFETDSTIEQLNSCFISYWQYDRKS